MNPSAIPTSPTINLEGDNTVLQNIFGSQHFGDFLSILVFIIGIIMAIVAITAIVALAINITRFAQAGSNPHKRAEAQHNMLICGICLGIVGGFGTIYAIIMMFVL